MIINVHSINQLLICLSIGYVIYLLYFDIFEIKFDNGRQLMKLLHNFKIVTFLLIFHFGL